MNKRCRNQLFVCPPFLYWTT